MRVGIPKEIKNHEYRVAITPIGVHELVVRGHDVVIETSAGVGSSITDDEYAAAGARIVDTPEDAWGAEGRVDMVLKVKEPVAEEYHRLREGLALGLNAHDGALTNQAVGEAVGIEAITPYELLA